MTTAQPAEWVQGLMIASGLELDNDGRLLWIATCQQLDFVDLSQFKYDLMKIFRMETVV